MTGRAKLTHLSPCLLQEQTHESGHASENRSLFNATVAFDLRSLSSPVADHPFNPRDHLLALLAFLGQSLQMSAHRNCVALMPHLLDPPSLSLPVYNHDITPNHLTLSRKFTG